MTLEPQDRTVPPYRPLPYYLQRIGAFNVIFYVAAALYFFDTSSIQHWLTLGATFITMAFIVCMTSCFHIAIQDDMQDPTTKASVFVIRHSLAWITFSQNLLLAAVYTFGWSPCMLTYLTIIINFLSGQTCLRVYRHYVRKCSADFKGNCGLIFLGILINILIPVAGILYSLKFKSQEDFIAVCILQAMYTLFYSATSIEYMIMVFDGVYLCKEVDAFEKQEKFISICANLAKEDPARLGNKLKNCNLACEVCFLEYNELVSTQIPRMLTKCGHTFCDQCSDKLAKINSGRCIICPTCRLQTDVPDKSVANLPKNFAIINLLREVNTLLEHNHLVDEISTGGSSDKLKKKCNKVGVIESA